MYSKLTDLVSLAVLAAGLELGYCVLFVPTSRDDCSKPELAEDNLKALRAEILPTPH